MLVQLEAENMQKCMQKCRSFVHYLLIYFTIYFNNIRHNKNVCIFTYKFHHSRDPTSPRWPKLNLYLHIFTRQPFHQLHVDELGLLLGEIARLLRIQRHLLLLMLLPQRLQFLIQLQFLLLHQFVLKYLLQWLGDNLLCLLLLNLDDLQGIGFDGNRGSDAGLDDGHLVVGDDIDGGRSRGYRGPLGGAAVRQRLPLHPGQAVLLLDALGRLHVVGEHGELLRPLLQVALVLDGVGEGLGEVGEAVRHVVHDDHLEEQGGQGQGLPDLGAQVDVAVAGTQAHHRQDAMAYELAGFLVGHDADRGQVRQHYLEG